VQQIQERFVSAIVYVGKAPVDYAVVEVPYVPLHPPARTVTATLPKLPPSNATPSRSDLVDTWRLTIHGALPWLRASETVQACDVLVRPFSLPELSGYSLFSKRSGRWFVLPKAGVAHADFERLVSTGRHNFAALAPDGELSSSAQTF